MSTSDETGVRDGERATAQGVSIAGPVRVEHLIEALGIGWATPRLSWATQAPPGWVQEGYQFEVERHGTTEHCPVVTSEEQVLVAWPGQPLASREAVRVRLRVHGADGSSSSWSSWTPVEAGLLEPADWSASFVAGGWREEPGTDRRPSRVRIDFVLDAPVRSARLYASAHGVFDAEINGHRVGDDVLSPGWTSYHHRLRYRTYDVTDLLRSGANTLGAWLGDGWYRGRLGFNGGHHDLYGTDLSFLAQLEVVDVHGQRHTTATDGTWQAAPSPILFAGLYDGEHYDARLDQARWSSPGHDDTGWTAVVATPLGATPLRAYEQPPVRCTEEVRPVSTEQLPGGGLLLDFGQNLVGRLQVSATGSAGDVVTLTHAEVLQDGRLYRRPLRLAASEDVLTLGHDGRTTWEPRFTVHGFRYAEVHGPTPQWVPERVVARVLHTDMRRTGTFECSDPLLNRLHENVVWSMRGNFVDIPTDCPQRDERLGWTGDIQVFAPTASFLYDCSGFLGSWLQDLAAEQLPDGTVPWFIPRIPGGPSWEPIEPGAVWGDAAVLTPWTVYQRFGDLDVLGAQYDSAKAWVDLVIDRAGPERLWDDGFQLGDWLDPAAPPEDPADARTDRYLVASAYFAHSTRHLGLIARLLGNEADAHYYGVVAEEARDAFAAAYSLPDGHLTSDAPTAYALAIVFDLLPVERAAAAGVRLDELVRQAGFRIATGFAGTPLVCDALSRTGHLDTAYSLLMERSCPSWLYTVLQGGTTIWERWDSMLPDGSVNPGEMTSFNHYALGSVADWMHRVVAGLAPTSPGYRGVRIAPRPGGGLTRARARHISPYGPVEVSWQVAGGHLEVRASLPVGVSADVDLSGWPAERVGHGEHHWRVPLPGGQEDAVGPGAQQVGTDRRVVAEPRPTA